MNYTVIDYIVGDRFQRLNFIGQGTFGRVFLAQDLESSSLVALKIEQSQQRSSLEHETQMLNLLSSCSGIPRVLAFGETDTYKYIALPLLGPSLEDRFIECQKKFAFLDFTSYAKQILRLIEKVHSYGIIHRDIKPRQILLGPASNKDQLYLIDFGISMKYRESEHVKYAEDCGFAGTCNYCSSNTHLGLKQSRRDDLESYCYLLAYFYQGSLPWNNVKASNQEVYKVKEGLTGKQLFGNVRELVDIFKYVKQLQFTDAPDYEYICERLQKLEEKHTAESRVYKQYTSMPISRPKKVKKKFTFIEDTEDILLNLDTTIVSKGPEIDRKILRKHY